MKTGVLISFVLHLLLLGTLLLTWHANPVGINSPVKITQAYLYQAMSAMHQAPALPHARSAENSKTLHAATTLPLQQHTHFAIPTAVAEKITQSHAMQHQNSPQHTVAHASQSRGNTAQVNNNQLLKLLHDAIQQKVLYPADIPPFIQKRTARVAFTLFPNGQLTQIRVTQSSGISSIDQAAINAVSAIQPLTGAKQYLNNPSNFALNVLFRR